MLEIDRKTTLMLAEHVNFRVIDNKEGIGFLLDSKTGSQYNLGPVEIAIVEQLHQGISQDDLESHILRLYPEQEHERVVGDLLEFVCALRDASLLSTT